MQLRLRMVEATGARPAIRACENSTVTMLIDDAPDFGGRYAGALFPGYGHELIIATMGAVTFVKPAFADVWLIYTQWVLDGIFEVLTDRRRRRVGADSMDSNDTFVFDVYVIDAPLGSRAISF